MPILTLAPMAGVSNWVFRLICARLGARLVGVEFINCRDIGIRSRKSIQMLDFSDAPIYADTGISLLAAQIYGNDIDLIANGAREFERRGAQVVDINFGCSVPKIVAKGCGAAYLRDLDRLYQAVERTVKAVSVPVIVKTRLGWDEEDINILEVVRRCEDAGAQAVAIHARTVVQKYKGPGQLALDRSRRRSLLPAHHRQRRRAHPRRRPPYAAGNRLCRGHGRAGGPSQSLALFRPQRRDSLRTHQLGTGAATPDGRVQRRAHRRPRDAQAPRALLQKPAPRLRTAPPPA